MRQSLFDRREIEIMSKIIIDASVVLKWIPGKEEEGVEKAREIYKLMMREKLEVWAPTFLLVEVLNILVKKRKADILLVGKVIRKLMEGKIKFIETTLKDIAELERIVFEQKVTAYDAIYLLLAEKNKVKLLTFDEQLLRIKHLTVGISKFLPS